MKVYHVTKKENLASIMMEGLLPKIGERSDLIGEDVEAVYTFPDKDSLENAMWNWLGEIYEDYPGDLVYLEIETNQKGDTSVGFEVVFYEAITVSEIQAVYNEDWTPINLNTLAAGLQESNVTTAGLGI